MIELLDRIWPRLTAEAFLHDLFGARPLLELAGKGVLSPDERVLMYRPRSETIEDIAWTAADVALLDEASWLLGPVRSGPATNNAPTGTLSWTKFRISHPWSYEWSAGVRCPVR